MGCKKFGDGGIAAMAPGKKKGKAPAKKGGGAGKLAALMAQMPPAPPGPPMGAMGPAGPVPGMKKGGKVEGESSAMMKKEIKFFKKKGAPKSMIRHEEAEMKSKGYARGGSVRGGGVARKGIGRGKIV